MEEQKTSYPLCWPEGWPRSERSTRKRSRFGHLAVLRSMAQAVHFLQEELGLLNALDPILSCNVKRRLDGLPFSNTAQPSDTGVAVYFKLKGKSVALACDKWDRVACNVQAIAKHIESLRGQHRWGVGNIEQAFRGYMALPGPGQSSGMNPWQVLGIPVNADYEQLREAYRLLAAKFHPDNTETGDRELFERVQNAYNTIAQNLRSKAA